VLNPAKPQPTGDLNNNSVVLRLVYGQTSFLFEGDAQADAESAILAAGVAKPTTVLKVAHHGSSSSSTPAFLRALKPQIAIYSAGAGNSYGHPHAQTIAPCRLWVRISTARTKRARSSLRVMAGR
jgi:competence protein ComEC